ncbi:chromosome segregation protein SMC [Phosphitispora sp. TUW77]|uniref:chromosome segregation protein SMC n=1 Tax=Phosphitispora sp. TUW77 TaxID=3152361 RepID=UPI003AB67F33
MYLKRIEAQGFKSLADRIELQFIPGITAVVGPNGSGKSNIADAVRWVLGEQSAKTLRGAKMEDVIFSGSDKRKSVGMAEVSLTLDNSTSIFALDYSEITVTRRVYRSGESEFLINKSPCRLRDIHELFMDTGIGREGYSIIGQGKIDEILSARAEDRRNIIEEAAGIVKYKNRKQQAVKKLNDTEQNLVRINDIISELELQIDPLEEQSKKAGEYLGYRNELVELEVNVVINHIEDQKQKLDEIINQNDDLQKKVIGLETGLRNRESEIEKHKLASSKIDEEIAVIQKGIYDAGNLIEKKEAEITVARQRLQDIGKQKDGLKAEIEELRNKGESERRKHAGDAQSLDELRLRLADKGEKLYRAEEQLSLLENELSEEQQKIEEKKADIIDLLNEIAGVRNAINSGETDVKNLGRRIKDLELQGETLKQEYIQIIEREKDLDLKLEAINESISGLKNENAGFRDREIDLSGQLKKLAGELERNRNLLGQKSSRLKALEDLQNDYEGYFRGVKEVLTAGKTGRECPGICGVVAELISVPEKYETAVEVALGSAIQHIVIETDGDARKAIEFLKKKKIGRATFLPLNTIKPSKDKKTETVSAGDGVYGRASSLVESDTRYLHIIDYLLGRVIIVDDLKTAIQTARDMGHTMKIVTLDGDVINPGGPMTGGSYKKGSSSLLGRSREIAETREQRDFLKIRVGELQQTDAALHKEYDETKRCITKNESFLQALWIEKTSLEKDLENIRKDKIKAETAQNLAEDEKTNLVNELKHVQINLEEFHVRLLDLHSKDCETRKAIEEQQVWLKGTLDERTRLSQQVTAIKVELAGLQQEEVNYARIIERVKDAIKDIEVQVQRKQDQVIELDVLKEQLQQEITGHLLTLEEYSRNKGEAEELLNKRKNEKQSVLAHIMEEEVIIKKLVRETGVIREQQHSSDMKRARLEFEIENSLTKLGDEFNITYEEALFKKTEITNKRDASARIKNLKELISALGNVNLGAIEEFEKVRERFEFLTKQYTDMEQAKQSLYKVIDEMDQIMTHKFREAYLEINRNFSLVFLRLFGGGKAELILTDSENVLETGIDIVAQPPGKKAQHLSLLSGGERALTAISLLFAILKTKPSPFCVLDEIEASLDEANVDRFAAYLKEFAANTQFIVITHRKGTMEVADIIYGVTMDDASVSKLVSMKFSDEIHKVS